MKASGRHDLPSPAGDLRKKMGIKSGLQEDPAYQALSELQQHLLVDRGPFIMRERGVPYLSKEGYPYHFFHEAIWNWSLWPRNLPSKKPPGFSCHPT